MIPVELTSDVQVFKDSGSVVEIIEDGPRIYIVFRNYPLHSGLYNLDSTDLMVFTTPMYPNSGLDMFWVDEKLVLRSGGVPKGAEQLESYLHRKWRRFSYHPYDGNQGRTWNPSEDSISSFMSYVEQRLNRGD